MLFRSGDPEKITCLCRTDPRTKFAHTDGITQYLRPPLVCSVLDAAHWLADRVGVDISFAA